MVQEVGVRAMLLRLAEVTEADWACWRALAERASEPNLALDPRFLTPEQGSGGDVDYLFVVAEEDGEWFGLLRVFAMDVSSTMSIPTYGTWDPPLFGASHPLLDHSRTVDALAAIARGIRRHLRGGFLILRGYPASGPLAEALQEIRRRPVLDAIIIGSHAAAWAEVTSYHAGSATDTNTFPARIDPDHHGSDTRKKLRRAARRLAEAGGGPLTLRDASDDPTAIDRFIAMQASGWKGDRERGGTAVALEAPVELKFREKVAAFRADGDLIILELWAGEQCVYASVYLVTGAIAEGFLDAYQHEFGDFSAGKLGRTAAYAHLAESHRKPPLVAVSPGIYDYYPDAATIYPDRREFLDVVIGVGIVPSLIVRVLPRAEASPPARKVFLALARADQFAMRVVGAARRRLKPKT